MLTKTSIVIQFKNKNIFVTEEIILFETTLITSTASVEPGILSLQQPIHKSYCISPEALLRLSGHTIWIKLF